MLPWCVYDCIGFMVLWFYGFMKLDTKLCGGFEK